MDASWQPETPLEFVALFVTMWFVILTLLALLGGWRRLANEYRAVEPFVGRKWHLQSASFRRFVNYSAVLTLGASPKGLYLAILFPFRIAHPPLLIPWSQVRRVEPSFFHIFSTPLELGAEPRVRITVSKRLVRKFEEFFTHSLEAA